MIRPLAVVMAGMVFPFVGSETEMARTEFRSASRCSECYAQGRGEIRATPLPVMIYKALSSTATAVGRVITPGKSPATDPETPGIPTIVLTTPAVEIFRIALLPVSATYKLPALSLATPFGELKRADALAPSSDPATRACPAYVLTSPVGVTLRMMWLLVSATYRLPAWSSAIPCGSLKVAASPCPICCPYMASARQRR